jgi:hypothetical protein
MTMRPSRHSGIQRLPGRVIPVVALTEPAADPAAVIAAELAAALARHRGGAVELLVIPGAPTPPPPHRVRVWTGGLAALPDRDDDISLVVFGLPPRDLPRLRVTYPDTVAVLVVPPSLAAAQAALRLVDQSAAWARRTVLVPLTPPGAPAMARAVLHVAGGAAGATVPLPLGGRRHRLRRGVGPLVSAVLDPPPPTWPELSTPALEEEHVPCSA